MKNLILLGASLLAFNSYANEGFDQMSIQEIYNRGYMLEATVTQNLGIRFAEGVGTVTLGNGCNIKLKETPTADSILRTGTKVSFEKIGVGFKGSYFDGLFSTTSASVKEIDYDYVKGHTYVVLAKLKEWCPAFHFEVVENRSLVTLE